MTAVHSKRELAGIIGHTAVVCLVTVLGLADALGLGLMPTVGAVRPHRPPIAVAPPAALDPSRFILNASSPGVQLPSMWAMCGSTFSLRRCATKSLWPSSSLASGFACVNTGACAMAVSLAVP
jgi:hypothetical protein